jgi:ParB-like chromosome segregation protein Spo0J
MKKRIDEIKVGERHRRDLGDVGELARSLGQVGLLHPVVITPENELIAGERRLQAALMLGWDSIDVTVVTTFSDAVSRLKAERDENTCRKDFTPSEAATLGKALEPLLRSEAKERQREGGRAGGKGSGKFPEASTGRTEDLVGEAVGMSGRTYQKAKAVVRAAEEDPEAFSAVVEEMDRTGKVDPAYNQVKAADALPKATNGKGPYKADTKKKSDVARKNYERLGILFGQIQAIADGIGVINLDAAMAILRASDAREWMKDARRTMAALRAISQRLKNEVERAGLTAAPGEAEDGMGDGGEVDG